MLPPIPSPTSHDCANCGAIIDVAKLKYCPNCGAALKRPARYSLATIIGATLLGITCVPMGACSILVLGTTLPARDSEGLRGVFLTIASVCLVLAALGIFGMIKMLRKK